MAHKLCGSSMPFAGLLSSVRGTEGPLSACSGFNWYLCMGEEPIGIKTSLILRGQNRSEKLAVVGNWKLNPECLWFEPPIL